MKRPRLLLLSAYEAVSHRLWREQLPQMLPEWEITALTLPPRHFAWRVRGNPLSWWHAPELQRDDYAAVLATSMVDLSVLRGLGFAALKAPCALYFHENQFAYPHRAQQKFSDEPKTVQLYAALAADRLYFNTAFNRDSFVAGVDAWLHKLPDHVPAGLPATLLAKSAVLPVPITPPAVTAPKVPGTVLWNHRWEYDKGPERLLALIQALDPGLALRFHVVGQQFRQVPAVFEEIHQLLIVRGWLGQWGYVAAREDYLRLLAESEFVLSTAEHDFQGLAVLEAVAHGARPLLPARLAYLELFADDWLYAGSENPGEEARAAATRLESLLARQDKAPEVAGFYATALAAHYRQTLAGLA